MSLKSSLKLQFKQKTKLPSLYFAVSKTQSKNVPEQPQKLDGTVSCPKVGTFTKLTVVGA